MNISFRLLVVSFVLFHFSFAVYCQQDEWLTFYELSGFKETPRYNETVEFAQQLAAESDLVRYQTFGTSPQGRDLPLLIISKGNALDHQSANSRKKSVVLIQACIHAGESDGKDAGLMLVRDMVIYDKHLDLLENVIILFVPIFNVDGHEQFSKYNRINQNGPEEMGWRATAQRLNLNRDYLKADAPEMQAMIRLYQSWLPDFYIDCHVTDGADYIYPLTYGLQMEGNLAPQQTSWLLDSYLPYVTEKMEMSGNPISPYLDFVVWHNPLSGIRAYYETPRYSGGYAAINNRPTLLIETHMLKDYKTRVSATYKMLQFSLEQIAVQNDVLRGINKNADQRTASMAEESSVFTLSMAVEEESETFMYKGYDFEVERSELSGGDWYQYSDSQKDISIPFYRRKPEKQINVPAAYIIPVELREIIDKLSLHQVVFSNISKDTTIEVETYRFEDVSWKKSSFEGRVMLDYKAVPIVKKIHYSAGSKLVRMNQRAAQLAMHMLEPEAPDSFLRWGFLNQIFEQKEYAESYVMEKMAREMLEQDPKLKAEFEQKKREDPNFGKNSYAVLNWFYQRSPYWDDMVGVYPIGRIVNKE